MINNLSIPSSKLPINFCVLQIDTENCATGPVSMLKFRLIKNGYVSKNAFSELLFLAYSNEFYNVNKKNLHYKQVIKIRLYTRIIVQYNFLSTSSKILIVFDAIISSGKTFVQTTNVCTS